MPRRPRFWHPGAVLHVVQRGNDRSAIFRNDRDRLRYLDCLADGAQELGVALHAYVLMDNHVHLLASPAHEDAVPRMMHFLGRYVGWFNYTYDRTGTLWEGRYKATLVDTDAYFLACMRYVELNPVRAGMVPRPADYPWSSHRANALGIFDRLVTPHSLYEQLAPAADARRLAYARWCSLAVGEAEMLAIRESTKFEWALGADAYCQFVESQTGRQATRHLRGRAPKLK